MANFDIALAKTLAHEGGYSNNPNDAGGETFCGISRRWHPKWEGWKTIDELKALGTKITLETTQRRKDVERFYYTEFWDKLHCDEIESQEIANALIDFAVNSGISDAVKALQNAINWFYVGGEQLKVDGIIGEETISALDVACANDGEIAIRLRFHSYRLAHILECIGNGTIHKSMAKGLARRAMV